MQGARSCIKPFTAGGSSGSSLDEASQLERHLQRQLEDDVARIFDESIYSDLEVVCGKLKILTHSCILKARTHKFYLKLEAILHVNIGRHIFDEIYSFISDAYTECNIQHQENEIINYLNEELNVKPVAITSERRNKQEDLDESDAYATPTCISPENNSPQKTLSSSPSTELTKEYYALVPIEGQILDKELIEQDELSSAFNSFIQLQTELLDKDQIIQCVKPTTLALNSSQNSKINKHSIICDISKDLKDTHTNSFLCENDKNKINNATGQVRKHISEVNKSTQLALKKWSDGETSAGGGEPAYTPDSLFADEPSSSSDYLSVAQSASPGGSHVPTSGPRDNLTKMNNTFTTVTDSGFDNNGMLESLTSHKDVTLNDVSLTESVFHDLLNDETVAGHDASDALEKNKLPKTKLDHLQPITSAHKPISEMSGTSSKDEKQRQNEEIVILESSSLSSETGSWESVFPPKMPEKDLCEKFLSIERQNSIEPAFKNKATIVTNMNMSFQCADIPQKCSYKSTCCFIDAASLVDEEDRQEDEPFALIQDMTVRLSSQPMPCEPKQDIVSPIDISESNENDDSLEQPDPDSIQKDNSPTIFEMTLVSDDVPEVKESLYEDKTVSEEQSFITVLKNDIKNAAKTSMPQPIHTSTPNNSIISLQASGFKTHVSEGSDNDAAFSKRCKSATEKYTQHSLSPIIQFSHFRKDCKEWSSSRSGMSLEDNLPQTGFTNTATSNPKRKIENGPIVSMACRPEPEKSPRASSCAAWVVDMSQISNQENAVINKNNKKPADKICDTLKASLKSSSNSEGCKSISSVDSDSSEKSTHKFYIDLSTLPDALTPESVSAREASIEKKNIFSMFIDLGENSTAVKEMPARLSSFNTKKTLKAENQHNTSKSIKTNKISASTMNGNDDAFEKLESLCNSSDMSISQILQNPIAKRIGNKKEVEATEIHEYHRTFPREGIAPTITEESDTDQFCDIFVRLSDLDKTPVHNNDSAVVVSNSECCERMTRSIPDNNWGESSQSSRSNDIISSFHSENTLSLNRLFPHLKNDISQSMPGSLSGRTRSPLRLGVSSSPADRDEQASDMSEISSVQSSMCRSVVENSTTEDTSHTSSLLINCQSRLGQDLLRMFVEEIAPDVIVEVSGRRIKAHKCILSSRCQYFAGILSGGWVESAGNVISLPPFSFSVVHFALCHIYSGISTIPDSISIVELATIADMLGLEGLKEAIMFTLKAKYCHHFHEPCQVCTVGVLECFPLTSVYGLDDLYRRCLRWITKHFRKVWPTKAFATLPSELLDKCYQEHLLNLTTDNLIDTVYGCGITVASLHRCRWAEVVARLCRRLAAAVAQYAAARLASVVRVAVAAREPAPPAAERALDECLAAAVERAPNDQLCRALALLHAELDGRDRCKPDLIAESAPHAERLSALRRRCEGALVRGVPLPLATPAFKELPHELRRRLRELMRRYVDPSSIAHSQHSRTRATSRSARDPPSVERARAAFVQRPPLVALPPSQPSISVGPPRVRSTKAQEERARYNLTKSTAAKPQEKANGKSKGRAAYENTKPRYLEPRVASKEPAAAAAAGQGARKPLGKLVSSSESSRNSSPVLPRAARACSGGSRESRPRTADPSTESLTDSLNANKYATYTKTRRVAHVDTHPSGTEAKSHSALSQPRKAKGTKIPVLLNQGVAGSTRASVPAPSGVRARTGTGAATAERTSSIAPPRQRGSLMMATKSSSAKMVPKINKETSVMQPKSVKQDGHAAPSKCAGKQTRPQSPPLSDIPVMERSGTFLKDEPTFGNITTDIDIDE